MNTKIDFLYLSEEDMLKAGVNDVVACTECMEELLITMDKGDYLMGGENGKDELFKLGISADPYGDIDKFGATFGAANADGKAIITELYAPVSDDVKSELADKYGAAMTNLGKLEEILPGVVEEIKAERAALIASIEVQ